MTPSSASPWLSVCKTCQDIWQRFADPKSIHQINMGSFDEALATDCPIHKPLVQLFIQYIGDIDPHHPILRSDDVGIDLGYEGGSVTMTQSVSEKGYFWDLLLVKNNSMPDHPGTGRILNADWVDLDLVKKWKNECLSSHGDKCENPVKIWATRPAWLIDVDSRCLVSGQVTGRFIALSYMYGSSVGLAIDAGTLGKLQQPYALDSLELSKYLSPTIRHAMYLTSVLGERYLWADALCITHDNPKVTTDQLQKMGAIYASAVLTIIAADGNSDDGLPGIRGISETRGMNQRIIPFGDETLVVRNTDTFSMGGGTEYYNRGWTYQEYKMSKRRILFNCQEVHWECQCNVWHEEMIFGAEIDTYIDARLAVILAGFPDLGSLGHIITKFNERELRYDEDALPAISGLLSVVSRSFTGGFLYGIPEMFFERGLGWKPCWDHTDLRRRTQSHRAAEQRLPFSKLPSWSWIGWQGLLNFSGGEAARINYRKNSIEETIPITEWYTGNSPDCIPQMRRRIGSTWFENRDSYKDFAKPLPPGWTRHKAPATTSFRNEPHISPDGCSKYVFKHEGMPDNDEENKEWYYPFPVQHIQESTPPFTPEQTPYLFCDTWKACLWGHQAGLRNMANLCDASGKKMGSLHLHNKESLALFPEKGCEGDRGLLVHLVTLYKSKRHNQTWDKEKEEYCLPITMDEKYVVLWVEWKDGVAYRLACGEVEVDEWEKLDLESISLILG